MVGSSHFTKSCPTCGRSVRINVHYLGREVGCGHCNGTFVATDNEAAYVDTDSTASLPDVMQRADELLSVLENVG